MTLKELYMYSAILTFLVNSGSIIMNNTRVVNEAKSRLKFRNDLSQKSKVLEKDIKSTLLYNVIVTDLLTLGIDVIPLLNVMYSVYVARNGDRLAYSTSQCAEEKVKQINEVEEEDRFENYKKYVRFTAVNNLNSLADDKEKKLSEKELIDLVKTHGIDPLEYKDLCR